MKIQMDAADFRDAIEGWLDARSIDGQNIDINLHASKGTLTRCEVIIREPLAEGAKPPRKRRIPILGDAT